MANVLSLALKINADATGLQTNLGKAERAFLTLQGQAERVTSIFDEFTESSEAATRAQQETAAALNELLAGVQRGEVSAAEFARQFAAIGVAAREEADALREAARITEANLTPLERFTREQGRLKAQLDAGRISTETYTRAINSAAKGLTDAERAAAGLAVQQQAIDDAAESTTLKFNELSGVFAVLPGPLGNIAGRISGIASASEGLSRIFAGGLQAGFSNLLSSVRALVNPLTAAVAGITAFAAAATAVGRGLVNLENRVEALGNQAFQLGVSFEFVQVLDESARRSGTSVDSLRSATTRLQQQLAEAAAGSETASAAIAGIGLSVEELSTLGAEDQFRSIARAVTSIEDPAERTAAATRLFGEAGVQLLPFFRNLEAAADDVTRFGAAISDAARADIDSLGAAFDDVGVALRGLGQSVLLPFVGLVEGVVTAFSGLINIVTVVSQTIGTVLAPVLNTVGTVFGAFGDAVNGTIGFFRSFFSTAEETAAATEKTAESVERTAEEIKALDKAFADSQRGLDAAIAKAGEFGQAGFDAAFKFQQALAELEEQASEGELNAEQYARGVANATDEFEKQIDVVRQVAAENKRLAEEAQRQADAITNRVDGLLAKASEVTQIEQDLNAVESEIARVEAAQLAARASGATAQADALASRLAQLDQLQAELLDKQDQAAQGFAQGLDSAFASVDRGINSLIDKASEFGNEGALAAQQLSDGIAAAQEQVRDGILNREAFEAEVARQRELYDQRIGLLEEEKNRRLDAEQEIANERQRVNQFVNEQLALAEFGGDSARLAASRNVQAIQAEIARLEQEIDAARQAGDQAAVDAGIARIGQLDQIAAKEDDIASGRKAAEEEIARRRDEQLKAAQQQAEQALKAQEDQAQQAQQAQAKQQQELQKAFEAQAKERERILERERELATPSSQAAQGNDIRTTEGANAFIQAIQGGFDPQYAVALQQLKVQREIAVGLAQNLRALGLPTFSFGPLGAA